MGTRTSTDESTRWSTTLTLYRITCKCFVGKIRILFEWKITFSGISTTSSQACEHSWVNNKIILRICSRLMILIAERASHCFSWKLISADKKKTYILTFRLNQSVKDCYLQNTRGLEYWIQLLHVTLIKCDCLRGTSFKVRKNTSFCLPYNHITIPLENKRC